jgi:hypothetical protein
MSFQNDVSRYYAIDAKITEYNEKLKILRSEKSDLTKTISEYADENNISNSIISLTDGYNFKITTTKSQSPLTFKYLDQSLNTIIGDKDKVDIIIKYLKEHRNSTENRVIKQC